MSLNYPSHWGGTWTGSYFSCFLLFLAFLANAYFILHFTFTTIVTSINITVRRCIAQTLLDVVGRNSGIPSLGFWSVGKLNWIIVTIIITIIIIIILLSSLLKQIIVDGPNHNTVKCLVISCFAVSVSYSKVYCKCCINFVHVYSASKQSFEISF